MNKYNESRKIEKFTGGLPTMSGNNSGNYAAWISIIVVGFGLLSFVFYMIFKNVKEKRRIDQTASNLGKQLDKAWGSLSE